MAGEEMSDPGADTDVAGYLRDCSCEDAQILGAPPLTDPHASEAEVLGGFSLSDSDGRIRDPPGKEVRPKG
jgi:hypothetical protein